MYYEITKMGGSTGKVYYSVNYYRKAANSLIDEAKLFNLMNYY